MNEQDKKDVEHIIGKVVKSTSPITRLNFNAVINTISAAAIIWIATEFNELAKKSIQREQEIVNLKEQVQELRAEIRYLRNSLFEHNKNSIKR